jgi:hypothetical protein
MAIRVVASRAMNRKRPSGSRRALVSQCSSLPSARLNSRTDDTTWPARSCSALIGVATSWLGSM